MTRKRWEITGGAISGVVCVIACNALLPLTWQMIALTIGIGILGNLVGRFAIHEWLEAGRK